MRTKSIVLLVLALGCGLIAAIGVTQVISQDNDSPKQAIETTNILVAKEDIAEGRKITPQLVKVEAWPKEKVPDDAIADLKEIEGMRARTDILVDEPLREKKLLGKGDIRTPTDHIDPGMRAVPIKIEKDSNAGLIRPGDRVDVLANLRKSSQNGIDSSRTITLLQNVEIFAVDDIFRVDPDNEGDEAVVAKTITLILTPKQAEKVDLAQQLGKLRIIMRSPNDEDIVEDSEGINTYDLLGNKQEKTTAAPIVQPTTTPISAQVVPVPTNEIWKMRILTGEGVNDVILEEKDGNDGKKVWRVSQEEEENASGAPPAVTVNGSPLGPIDSSLEPPGLEPSE